jgi:hypothetical protein
MGSSEQERDGVSIELEIVGRVINRLTRDQRQNLYSGEKDYYNLSRNTCDFVTIKFYIELPAAQPIFVYLRTTTRRQRQNLVQI